MTAFIQAQQNVNVKILRVSHQSMINYCYVVTNQQSQQALLIDPAWESKKIEQALHGRQLKGILLTHHHFDHIDLSASFAKKYNVPVYMSQIEIDTYQFQCPHLISINIFDQFNLATINVLPIFSPGHTKGGTSYLIGNHLFTGDTLFIEGCGLCRTQEDAREMFKTLHRLKKLISPETIIYPGHCYGIPVGQTFETVMRFNIYLMIENEDEFVAYRMRGNQKNLMDFK